LNPSHQTFRRDHCGFHGGSLVSHDGSLVRKAALFCGLTALAMSTGGCFMAAFALAPVAVQLVRAAGSGIASAAKSTESTEATDSEICDMGGRRLPPLIEFRTDKLGTTLYRPYAPSGLRSDSRVVAVVNQSGRGGWNLAGSFTRINFKPPLQDMLVPRSMTYLAYAPAEVRNPAEQADVEALKQDFGQNTGTFDWNGRVFQYTAVHQLPCAAPPSVEVRAGGP
jgi:hypothetical protein